MNTIFNTIFWNSFFFSPDLSKICVELSFGFFLELNLDEIPNILSLKQEFEHR